MGDRGTIIAQALKRKADRRGTLATFKAVSASAFTPSTGAVTNTTSSFEARGFFESQSERQFTNPAGVTITRAKGKVFYLPAYGLTTAAPRSGDACHLRVGQSDEKRYLVGEVEPMTADDVVTCYMLELKDA